MEGSEYTDESISSYDGKKKSRRLDFNKAFLNAIDMGSGKGP
jgi:hypothetical protein